MTVNRLASTLTTRAEPPVCIKCPAPLVPVEAVLETDQTTVAALCPGCGEPNTIRLADLCCGWFPFGDPPKPTFGVWHDRNLRWRDPGPYGLAPKPEFRGESVVFEYPRTVPSLAGRLDPEQRSLTLHLNGREPRPLSLREVFFRTPAWPGNERVRDGVALVPLRPEYLGLLPPDLGTGAWSESAAGITYAAHLRGLPRAILLEFDRPEHAPSVALAVLPDPRRVPPSWRWFRLVGAPGWNVDATGCRAVTPSMVQCEGSLPPQVCLVAVDDRAQGMCLLLSSPRYPFQPQGEVSVNLAVDFGTTNSVVYFRSTQAGRTDETPFEPVALRTNVWWPIEPPNAQDRDALLDRLLPGPTRPGGDGTLVPSEICSHQLINWATTHCCEPGSVKYLFKNDENADPVRQAFLHELFVHALAAHLAQLPSIPEAVTLRTVFAYPLTFTPARVDQFARLVNSLMTRLKQTLGLTAHGEPLFIDESAAGVKAVGHPHADDIVLTADLGGGTMDVSLGRGASEDRWFIGSLDCGGRYLLDVIAGRDARRAYELQGDVRVEKDSVRATFRQGANLQLLGRYMAFLFFYLETMALAYLKSSEGASSAPRLSFKVYLLGNGWSFFRLTANPRDSIDDIFRQSIGNHLKRIEASLARRLGKEVAIEWCAYRGQSKHAVAHGALKSVDSAPSRMVRSPISLPTGITSRDTKKSWVVDWSRPFGPVTATNRTLVDTELTGTVVLDADELEERIRGSSLEGVAGLEPPRTHVDAVRQLLIDSANRCGGVSPTGYYRGPLQLLLESCWVAQMRP